MEALIDSCVSSTFGTIIRKVAGHKRNESFTYTACYCEENVHRLASTLVGRGQAASLEQLYAVFISNPRKQVPLWQQRAGRRRARSWTRSRGRTSREGRRSGGRADKIADGSDLAGSDDADDSASWRSDSGGDDSSGSGSGSGADGDGCDDDDEGLVVWDYHVILVQAPQPGPPADAQAAADAPPPPPPAAAAAAAAPPVLAESGQQRGSTQAGSAEARSAPARCGALVWDLDTLLPMPCSLETYARRALKVHYRLPEHNRRFFRLVPAASYLRHFASDRRHMRTPAGGWTSPPPPYPPIVAAATADGDDGAATHNIHHYWDMAAGPTVSVPATAAAGQEEEEEEGGGGGRRRGQVLAAAVAAAAVAGPYGVVLDERSFLAAFGADVDALTALTAAATVKRRGSGAEEARF